MATQHYESEHNYISQTPLQGPKLTLVHGGGEQSNAHVLEHDPTTALKHRMIAEQIGADALRSTISGIHAEAAEKHFKDLLT